MLIKILWKEKIHLRENRPIFLGIWGEEENIPGAEEFLSSMHYFQGSREHTDPGGGGGGARR